MLVNIFCPFLDISNPWPVCVKDQAPGAEGTADRLTLYSEVGPADRLARATPSIFGYATRWLNPRAADPYVLGGWGPGRRGARSNGDRWRTLP